MKSNGSDIVGKLRYQNTTGETRSCLGHDSPDARILHRNFMRLLDIHSGRMDTSILAEWTPPFWQNDRPIYRHDSHDRYHLKFWKWPLQQFSIHTVFYEVQNTELQQPFRSSLATTNHWKGCRTRLHRNRELPSNQLRFLILAVIFGREGVWPGVSQNETLDLEDIFRSLVETQCYPVDANVQHELQIGTIPRGQSRYIQNRIRSIYNLSLILPPTTARFEKWANREWTGCGHGQELQTILALFATYQPHNEFTRVRYRSLPT